MPSLVAKLRLGTFPSCGHLPTLPVEQKDIPRPLDRFALREQKQQQSERDGLDAFGKVLHCLLAPVSFATYLLQRIAWSKSAIGVDCYQRFVCDKFSKIVRKRDHILYDRRPFRREVCRLSCDYCISPIRNAIFRCAGAA